MFKAILWDNDGVLVDTEPLYRDATRQIFASAGIDLNDDDYRRFFLEQNNGAWHLLSAQGRADDEIARLRDDRNRLYSTMLRGRDHSISGVREVVQSLHGRYAMGIVTSSRREHFEIIHA
jgi:beta-phosphoglucomutase-like phosphatase (HAD superfamily)